MATPDRDEYFAAAVGVPAGRCGVPPAVMNGTTRGDPVQQNSCEIILMSEAISSYSVEERIVQGGTVWVAIRARGAEWSWLTPAEAARLGREWVERYGGAAAYAVRQDSDSVEPLIAAE